MDMDSTRRSFDRSSQPGAKKPRLIDELDRGSNPTARPFPQLRQPPPATARFRTNGDRLSETEDPGRVGYHPQAQAPHLELVGQYKSALAELTFNSKPIITNLTIIAGENLSAAKAIAGAVCNNILEVPSEQKLPSLYLLDSIVKNIGQDYIKYFAARLPEVFCKAYQQVDPSVHTSMRHLFGTWKLVFPPQTLQMIEKELGFTPAVNGSASASATLRTDSQSQRSAHSIHVNPKYLERQRLQQSSRKTKVAVNDMTGAVPNSNEDPERPHRALGASRPWLDPRINMHGNQRIRREAFDDSVHEKSVTESYGGIENSSDISSKLGLSKGRTGSRVTELGHDKTWYKGGIDVAETTVSGQRNGFSFKLGFSNLEAPKSMNLDARHQPIQNVTNIKSSLVSNSWKNSDEEEFIWDEMNSGMTGVGAASVPNNLKGPWMGGDDENLEGEGHLQITHPFSVKVDRDISVARKPPAALGGPSSLSWQLQEQRSIEKLNMKPGHSDVFVPNLGGLSANKNSLVARMGNRSFKPNATTGFVEIMGQQQFDSVGAESTSGQSPLRPQSPSVPVTECNPHTMQNMAEPEHPQVPKASEFLGGLQSHYIRDRPPVLAPNSQVGNLRRLREKDLQGPLSSVTSFQPRHQQLSSSQTTVKTKKPPQSKVSLASETSEQSTTSNSSCAASKSGILSNKSTSSSFRSTSSLATSNLPSELGVQPTQSGGPSPASLISLGSAVSSPSLLVPSNYDLSAPTNVPKGKAGQPPRVSTQLPASANVSSASAATSNTTKNNSLNPIANLLSSLVAKGLISAETESPTKLTTEALVGLEEQAESITASSPLPVAPVSHCAAVPIPSTKVEVDDVKPSLALCQSTSTEVRKIIGFDFKPDVIRELHPAVIKELLDDFPHHCVVCGIRLRQEEKLNRHLEWHSTRERERNGLTKASRKWYANSVDWIAGKADSELSDFVDVYGVKTDMSQLDTMVLADENQCLCVLCGELFEDVYCEERGEWMFGGAVYMNNSDDNGEMESGNLGPIIHAKCLSENSLSSVTKMEQD